MCRPSLQHGHSMSHDALLQLRCSPHVWSRPQDLLPVWLQEAAGRPGQLSLEGSSAGRGGGQRGRKVSPAESLPPALTATLLGGRCQTSAVEQGVWVQRNMEICNRLCRPSLRLAYQWIVLCRKKTLHGTFQSTHSWESLMENSSLTESYWLPFSIKAPLFILHFLRSCQSSIAL